jgi:hypothetical protein
MQTALSEVLSAPLHPKRAQIQLHSGGLNATREFDLPRGPKTKGGSGAFIKELVRRSAQFLVETDAQGLT